MIKKFLNQRISIKANLYSKKSAFTFMDMILSIGIIGVVAMIVMPRLIDSYNEMMTISLLRKEYATYSNAFNLAVANNGTPDYWNLGIQGDPAGLANLNTIMSQTLRVTKNCGTGPGCFPETSYKNLKDEENPDVMNQDQNYTKMVLVSGSSVSLTQWDPDCNIDWGNSEAMSSVCGMIGVDVNGFKSPNKYGVDYFGFVITKLGIFPMGSPAQSKAYPFNGFCNRNSNANNTYENGLSCSAWVLANENMDYLDCNNLNWNGRKTCK